MTMKMTMLTIFDNFGQIWTIFEEEEKLFFLQYLTISKCFEKFHSFWHLFNNVDNFLDNFEILTMMIFLTIYTIETILTIVNVWQFRQLKFVWHFFYHFDNCKDNPGDLWHLRHWLQFWQLRTRIQTIFVTWQLRVTLDSICNSCDVCVRSGSQIWRERNTQPVET